MPFNYSLSMDSGLGSPHDFTIQPTRLCRPLISISELNQASNNNNINHGSNSSISSINSGNSTTGGRCGAISGNGGGIVGLGSGFGKGRSNDPFESKSVLISTPKGQMKKNKKCSEHINKEKVRRYACGILDI